MVALIIIVAVLCLALWAFLTITLRAMGAGLKRIQDDIKETMEEFENDGKRN